MSVTSYIPSLVCGYKYSKLKNVVYLVSKSHVKEVRVDDGEAYVLNLVETPMRIDCHSVEFTENESLDERYKFSKTLRFTVDGYANVQSLEGGCYAIIITYDGVPYMVNIDFPAKATYTFTLSDKQNQTEFTLSSTSNYPTLRLQGNLDTANTFVCKPYREYGIEQLELIEKNYVTINDQTATVTTIGGRTFKEIDFNRHSCTLQETFDGEACTDVITFDIGFDAYKPSWQYNLLEFTDNLYAAMVTPKSSSNKFFVGFNFGLDPQYVIDSTTSEGNSDKITITLSEKSVHGMITLENPRIIDDDDTYWQYVDYVYDYETYECIDNGVAKYLAMQELDSLNNPTGNYKVLRGYRDRYEGKFNIIGEFDDVVTFFTTKCSWYDPCTFTGLPSIITFIGTVCHSYTVYGSCDWHFENMPNYLTYSRTSGAAGETYTIEICNRLATDVTVTGSFDVIYGDKTDTIDVQIITGDMKLQAYYNNQTRYQLPCDGSTALTQTEVRAFDQATIGQMTEAIIGTCIDRVDDNAFQSASALTAVTIPEGIRYIDNYAFYGDGKLQSIDFPDSLYEIGNSAFYGNSGATSLDLGNGVERINFSAFAYCYKIPSIYIPNSVNYMGTHTFYANSGATSLHLSENSAMTKVPNYSFRYCTSLPSVVIPNNYTEVGSFAFSDCSAMTSVTLSENMAILRNSAFEYNPSLQSITLPQSLQRIEQGCFRLNTALTSVTIPSDVTYIGANAFSGDTSLEWVVCEPMTPPTVGGSAMFDVTNNCPIYVHCEALPAYQVAPYWTNYRKRLRSIEDDCPVKLHTTYTDDTEFDVYCNSSSTLTSSEVAMGGSKGIIKEAVVGTCTEIIGTNAFENADALTAVTLPNTIKRIDNYGFYSCDILPNITLPCSDEGLVIGSYSFAYCRAFTHITLPDCLTSASSYAFAYDTSVTGITFGTGLTYISDHLFFHNEALPAVTIPSHINSVGNSSFAFNYALTSATISEGVNTIGGSAFNTCNQLTGITIPNSVTTLGALSFENCTSLKYANIGTGVTYIDSGTFRNDSSLTSVTMSNDVTGITEQAFQSCTSLPSIDLPDNLVTLGNAVFRYDSALTSCTIPSTVTSMGAELFNHCTSLEYVWMEPTVPPTLTSSNAFDNTNNCPIYVPCQSLAAYQTASQWSNVRERLVGYGDDCPIKYKHGYTNYRDYTMFCDAYNYMTTADTKTRPKIAYNEMTYTQIGECVQTINADTYSGCSLQTVEFLGDDTLHTIGNNAFRDCTNLRSIEIPNSVNSIGTYAFANDFSLTAATLPTSISYVNLGMFNNCTSLPTITIPNNVTSIYDGAFQSNLSLTSVTLSNNLTEIRGYAFEHDRALTGITLPNTFRTFGNGCFKDCTSLTAVTIPSSVTSIGSETFSGDTALEYIICEPLTPPSLGNINAFASDDDYPIYVHCSALGVYQRATNWKTIKHRLRPIETPCEPKLHAEYEDGSTNDVYCDNNSNLPQSDVRNDAPLYSIMIEANIGECVSSIGNNAFQDCVLLEEATMHDTITSIGSNAFRNCNSMSSITMSNNVVSIGENAFYECTSLSGITLPNTLTTIGNNAFHHCANIVGRVNVPNSVTSFGSGVFSNCYHIDSVTLPNTLSRIPDNSFQACLALSSVTIPNTVTEIGKSAFEACIRLTGVTLPQGLTTIGANAFEDCERLQSIRIPQSVTSIGTQAFYYCSGLTEIYMESDKPPVLSGESVFDFTNDCPIYVPCMASYSIAKGWTEYVGRMVEYGGGCSFAMQSHYSDNTNYSVFCYDLPNGVLGTSQTRAHTTSYTAMTRANIMDCTTTIGDYAFDGCRSLTSVTIPSSVSSINQYAFRNCNQISSITLPNSITNIGSYAFDGCSGMTSLTIPANVSNISNSAFRNCSSLQGIYPQSTTAPDIGSYAFDGTNNCPIYLPTCDSATSYWSKWSSYRSRFVLPSDCPTGVTIDLNSQWSGSTSYGNLSSASTEYNFYESFSNWHVHSSTATTYLTVTNTPIEFYIRSYAESSYDYVEVLVDGSQIASTKGSQSSTVWTKVNADTMVGTHIIEVRYRKDGSEHRNDDRGYLALPKRYLCQNTEERWIGTGVMKCINNELHEIEKKQWRCVGDTSWIDAGETRTGTTSHGECHYTELDWIERDSSHTAALPLGLSLKDNTMFKIKVMPTNGYGGMIVGEPNAPSDDDDYRLFWNGNTLYYDYGSSRLSDNPVSTGTTYNLEIGNYYVKNIDTSAYILQGSTKSGTATSHTRNLSIFQSSYSDYARIFYLQVYEGSTLVKDLIPVRDMNGVVTMYDRVSGTIMTPEGGTFKGSDE